MTLRVRPAVAAVATGILVFACSNEARIDLLAPEVHVQPDSGIVPEPGPEAGTDDPSIDELRRSACARFVTSGEREQALLMMVIDVSNSMATPFGSNGSRWDAERPILAEAVASLPSNVGLGALYYPNMPTPQNTQPRPSSACVNTQLMIPVNLLGAADSRQRQRILRSLADTSPSSNAGTPTLDAYLIGLSALGNTTLAGSRQMLLITDGQPTFSENCVGTGEIDDPVDFNPILETISAAARAGVKTFVIGSPGSDSSAGSGADARPWLSRAAEAGGTARASCSHTGPNYCHFDMASETDLARGLSRALEEIEERIVICDYVFPDTPNGGLYASESLKVVLTTTETGERLIPQNQSPSCVEGWQYKDAPQRVSLCDRTCAALREQRDARLEFLFPCVASE